MVDMLEIQLIYCKLTQMMSLNRIRLVSTLGVVSMNYVNSKKISLNYLKKISSHVIIFLKNSQNILLSIKGFGG